MRACSKCTKRSLLVSGLCIFAALTITSRLYAQGCFPATPQHLAHNLVFELPEDELFSVESTESDVPAAPTASPDEAVTVPRTARDLQLLRAQNWNLTLSWRHYESGDSFVGTEKVAEGQVVGEYSTLDILGTYAFNRRWGLTVALPIINSKDSFQHPDGQFHSITAGTSVGDLRVTGSYWVYDPGNPRRGNVALGLGIKAPTGSYDETAAIYFPDHVEELPVDLAVQPGDGGWGITLATQSFHALAHRTYFYGDGFYLLNPRDTNGTVTPASFLVTGFPLPTSVPDQYSLRVGVGYLAWPRHGISLSLGMRLDGIPKEDLIGDSNGFRRPGYNLAVDPGLNVNWGPHTFSVYVPIAVKRSVQQSLPEYELSQATGTRIHGGGSLAGEAFFIGYSRRFGKPAGSPDS